ncbi:M23 family metallopeptidase [Pannonibacter sp. SL95]|jgi:murein DD-endopeptidase MepM/ murein hydrolase activator NlpD|uniref:M23 family metallopeptidase n=1 Tax=Pannonibacter sp. SL95 TaxID=2995153 RepID=UPI0022729803|nr:M23 family metallopeptidase [Pannonibacter sp. SL95]MCY1707495.1 peptidoglycan DD-metalloendopeptidase family protein [Pannonibacter sp. SL95]
MTSRMRIHRKSLWTRVAAIGLIAGLGAGCSGSFERFADGPVYTGGTANQRSILGKGNASQPSYQDIVRGPGKTAGNLPASGNTPKTTGSIASTKLPPVPGTAVSSAPPPVKLSPTGEPVIARPNVAAVTAPVAAAAEAGENSWKGWTSTGGTRIQLREGDSVAGLGKRYGVPAEAIMAVNGLDSSSKVGPGQSVIIPTYVYAANNAATTAASTKPVKLPPASGAPETTGSISPTANVLASVQAPGKKPASGKTVAALAPAKTTATDARPSAPLVAGQPAPAKTAPVTALRETPGTSLPAADKPALEALAGATQDSKPLQTASVDPQEATGGPMFRWPVRGRVISEFGAKPGGSRNDGINLAVPEGTPVKAAGDGSVIYAGNELKGFGNLVLIRHDDGWVSAYAHNSEILVKRGEAVQRGQVISKAGASGSVSQPQVHFELRKDNKPVDPMRHLPRG